MIRRGDPYRSGPLLSGTVTLALNCIMGQTRPGGRAGVRRTSIHMCGRDHRTKWDQVIGPWRQSFWDQDQGGPGVRLERPGVSYHQMKEAWRGIDIQQVINHSYIITHKY
jgi:hypothetical protein